MFTADNKKKYFLALNVMCRKRYIAQLLQCLISVKYRVFLKLNYNCKMFPEILGMLASLDVNNKHIRCWLFRGPGKPFIPAPS